MYFNSCWHNMETIKDILLGVLCLMLWCTTLILACTTHVYEQRLTSYGAMREYYTLRTSTCLSEIACSRWCKYDEDCVSFLFDEETSNCTTFSEYAQCAVGENTELIYVKSERELKPLWCECHLVYNSSFVNVALGKQVTLSTTWSINHGGRMVDGNRSAEMPCAHTKHTLNPYAVIDLQQSYNIHSIYLVNRADIPERLHDLKILVGEDLSSLDVCIDHPAIIGLTCTLRVPVMCQGRYVKFQLFATEFLQICERVNTQQNNILSTPYR